MVTLALIMVLSPLLGAILAGIGGRWLGRSGAHRVTILLMLISFSVSALLSYQILVNHQWVNAVIYPWVISGSYQFNIGFLMDPLTAVMIVIVTFISLLVHIYSIGYMHDDAGYQRFFSYMSLFTFAMLMLVTANNFLQLFFGWEGVGLVSYLLIGFWFETEAAAFGSLKAFIVNRIGDMGFLLGIAAILDYCGSLNYAEVFAKAPVLSHALLTLFPGHSWHLINVICILLFIGAMGKSAQIPLHVWLPESMAGPTPISALIHAATMVTAGIYMVARMSPLFELSIPTLSFILVVGSTGALFLGLLAFVENDIKRVIAYSTLSQLGYMMAANGASAFSAAIFHLLNHACFKALLFLAAGSLIIALHHEQDLRKMGHLRRYMPVTYVTFLVGALALAAIPPFSGFYSKDAIIEAVHQSTIPGAGYAYFCLLIGCFVTSYYIFRAFFLAFHGKPRMQPAEMDKVRETRWSMLIPLIILAILSILSGLLLVHDMLYRVPNLLGTSILVLPHYDSLRLLSAEPHGFWIDIIQAFSHLMVWLSLLGIVIAWLTCVRYPSWRTDLARRFALLNTILLAKYGFDDFNQRVIVAGAQKLSHFFYRTADLKCIDTWMVDGAGRQISNLSRFLQQLQSGYLYNYAFIMIVGLLGFLIWLVYF